jgi:NADH dehydrogenase FAD-containing subunit
MEPIRGFTKDKERECVVIEGTCTKVSPEKKCISVSNAEGVSVDLPFDKLVIACGAGFF